MMRGTTLIRLRRTLMNHLEERQREGGVAMLTAILFIIIMAGVSTIILGVVTAQTIPGYLDQKGTKTIYSAQAGIEAALSIIRTATTLNVSTGTYQGDTTKLPCSSSSTSPAITGNTNGTSDGNGYSVVIQYYTVDPITTPTAVAITCGTGTYGTAAHGPTTVPKYALITSSGAATQIPVVSAQANRSLTALYTFSVSTANILGGLINNNGASACLQAVKAQAGQAIAFVAASGCSSTGANAALQLWSYTSAWQIVLTSTTTNGVLNATSLCITGPTVSGGATQNALLQVCQGPTAAARWNQLWSWTGSYTWEGELQAITGPNPNAWLSPPYADGTSPIGKDLEVVNASSPIGTMAPTAQVGAGAAAYGKHQIVNYLEFGRCLDVTNQPEPDTDAYPMIDYPCKQDPTGGTTNITWNQLWFYCEVGDVTCDDTATGHNATATVNPAAQQIYVLYNNSTTSKYCLTTPSPTGTNPLPTSPTSTAANQFVYFQPCATSGALVAQQTWKRVYTGDDYLDSYLFIDTYGRCLGANQADIFTGDISEITVNTCNGADYQKWNAPPTQTTSTVGGYREVSGG